jgi:D-arabinose 1-dehydrogenase-like Zn-dependent alcohol dehydrogenase
MKALVLNEIKQPLVLQERPSPKAGKDKVIVKLMAAALNRRDYWITQGMYPGIQCPIILGSDGAGTADFKQSQVIINPGYNWGGHQEAQSDDFKILGMPIKLELRKVFWKQLHLVGSTMGSPDDFAAMLSMVCKHKIEPVIDEVFALSDSNKAFKKMNVSSQFGKLVLQVSDN